MTDRVNLGSGDLYILAYDAATGIPVDATIETSANKVGSISGGASLEVKTDIKKITDDSGAIDKRFIIGEEVMLKSGVLSWDMATLSKLVADGTYTDDTVNHKRTLKLGGLGARLVADYVIRFVHTEADGEKFRLTIVGNSNSGLSLAFAKDKETVVDAEFEAKALDSNGVKVIMEETYTPAT